MSTDEGTNTPTDSDISKSIAVSQGQNHTSPVRGEIALWHAVLNQALFDARMKPQNNEDRHLRWQALHWLAGKNPDFVMVCDLAMLDPARARRKIARMLKNHKP